MPTTYTSKYATGAAVDAALDKAMSAVQPTDVLPVFIKVKNVSGGSLAAGTPVYPNGTVGAGDVAEVVLARADNAALSPAAAILNTTLANNASGTATVIGQMTGIDTSGLNLGNVYLAPTGGLTNTAPTDATHIVQWLGTVERKNASTGIVYANVTGPMAPIQDTPADGVTTAPVSSNWAFDHAAATLAHGISAFGATLVDDTSASAARTTLGAAADTLDNVTLARPSIRPSLLLDFANAKTLDPRITFTRDATATYYDGHTTAKAEENLLLYSQDFTNAAWVNSNTSDSGDSVAAPDGTTTADTITATAGNGTILQTFTAVAGGYTFSVYLKRKTGTGDVQIAADSGTWTTKAIDETWTRYSVTQTLTAGSKTAGIKLVTDTDEVYAWGAQLELRSSMTAYTPTTSQPITNYIPVLQSAAANVARFDHDPVTGESKGLLIEEQRTNLLTYSEDFANAAWKSSNSGSGTYTLTANQGVAPDGTLSADQIVFSAISGSQAIIYQNFAATVSNSYTASFFIKALTANDIGKVVLFRHAGSSGMTALTLTSTWQRVSSTEIAAVTSPSLQIGLRPAVGGSSGSVGILIWGAQLEAGSFPTSYIKTTSAQVTRAADAASMTGTNFSSWFNNAEGSFYASLNAKALTASSGVQANDDSTNNRLRLALTSTSDQGTVTVNGTAQATLDGGTPAADTATKVAMGYKLNDFGLALNGGTIATDTSGLIPVVNQLQIGAETTTYGNLHLKKVAYWPKKLTSAELVALTA